MNKLLLAAVLVGIGGFLLGDAAQANLTAKVFAPRGNGHAESTSPTASNGGKPTACMDAFKTAQEKYKIDVRMAQEKWNMAVQAKNTCMRNTRTETPKPSVTRTATPTVTPTATPTSTSAVH